MRINCAEGRSRPRIMRLVLAGIALLVLLAVLWIAVRGLIARDQLLGAAPLARSVSVAVVNGDAATIDTDVAQLQERAAMASSLTSDPVWRAAEIVPVLGANLTAFRQAAEAINEVSRDALPPLKKLATAFSVKSFAPKKGAFDLTPFAAASPILCKARAALDAADTHAQAIDTSGTVAQVGEGVDRIIELINQTRQTVDGLDTAASLLPSMLGAQGPRSYLLLSLNNAELRSTGGIPGALSVVTVDNGVLKMGEHTSAAALGEFAAPVLPLTAPETALFKKTLGKYLQDVNFTPDFARSGALTQAMWKQRTGHTVDGVIAVDPVALGYILNATGPINTGSGVTLTAATAERILLSDVYSKFPKPADQDVFFADVTSKVFDALTSGDLNPRSLVSALAKASTEGRIHVWSAHESEQKQLSGSALAGPVPKSTKSLSAFGVYFNDATGAKMDYYLSAGIGVASTVCRADHRPYFEVRVGLTSTAPADAATSLPGYVTGGGYFGVDPGSVGTNVYVYAPSGSQVYSVTIDGKEYSFVAAEHDGNSVAGINVVLKPGESAQITVKSLGKAHQAAAVTLVHTPMAWPVKTSIDNYMDCPRIAPSTGTNGS